MNCGICDKNLGLEVRWVLVDETQKLTVVDSTQIPEIDIKESIVIGSYCCERHASEACKVYLATAKAEATWSAVKPKENCSICKANFNTDAWHKVLTLSQECGYQDDPEIIDTKYVTRFCPSCIPYGMLVI